MGSFDMNIKDDTENNVNVISVAECFMGCNILE